MLNLNYPSFHNFPPRQRKSSFWRIIHGHNCQQPRPRSDGIPANIFPLPHICRPGVLRHPFMANLSVNPQLFKELFSILSVSDTTNLQKHSHNSNHSLKKNPTYSTKNIPNFIFPIHSKLNTSKQFLSKYLPKTPPNLTTKSPHLNRRQQYPI